MRVIFSIVMVVLVLSAACATAHADSVAVLKQGLLGAGTGAVASVVSGGKGDRIWQGALAGAGVNVVGGALLDILTGERVGTVTYVTQAQPVVYVRQARPVRVMVPVRRPKPGPNYRRVYREGYVNGYNQGYRDGYEDAVFGSYNY